MDSPSPDLDQLFPGARFSPIDPALLDQAQERLDQLTKPQGSLGELETIARRLFAISGGRFPLRIDPAILYTVAADHGVAAQGVSAFPQEVTRQMADNYLNGGAAINVLCRANSVNAMLVDAGCLGENFPPHRQLLQRRLGQGSSDLSLGPAMDEDTCVAALRNGFAIGCSAAQNGFACIGTGELGIANSTAATALYCAFYGLDPHSITGPGAMAPPPMVKHKADIIARALQINRAAVDSGDPARILASLGGLEIATLTGIMLACGANRLPLVVDGFICASAYAAATAIWPPLADFAFLSHMSAEPGFAAVVERMKPAQRPLLRLGLRLGEGTGAALAITLLRSAAAIFNEMATFTSAGVADKKSGASS